VNDCLRGKLGDTKEPPGGVLYRLSCQMDREHTTGHTDRTRDNSERKQSKDSTEESSDIKDTMRWLPKRPHKAARRRKKHQSSL